jgi:two-component system sensor histidine kinase/response regulator
LTNRWTHKGVAILEETPEKILVIDDEKGIQRGCARALEPAGYRVEVLGTLAEGREKLGQADYDLVLLDVMLPDGQGIDLLPVIKQQDPDTVVVIITGFATVELAVQAIKQGAYDFIAKPFTPDLLLMTVEQGLERRRLSLDAKRVEALEQETAEMVREKEEMERLNEFKTSFTLMVAHELRAPISALLSFLRTMRKGYVSVEQQEDILDRSIDRAEELLDLVNDLLSLAKARQPPASAKPVLVDLSKSLEKVAELLRPQAQEKKINLQLNVASDPVVSGYEDQMEQVWMNLISNAIKYTPEGGQVKVGLDTHQGWAVGSVEDTGIGIEPELQEKIFEDFYRAPRAKAFNRLGTGLGLTLVKQILEGLGGRIEVESKPEEGSRFTFEVPLADQD